MDEPLERAIVNLRGALRASAWAEVEQSEALVREARDACDEWLARCVTLPLSAPPPGSARQPGRWALTLVARD